MTINFEPIETGNDALDILLTIITMIIPFIIAIIVVYSDGGEDNEE